MIGDIKKVISKQLKVLHPNCIIYDEDVPQNFKTPSFMISVVDQDYNKLLNVKSKSTISFDLAYFSDSNKVKTDTQVVQESLLRGFDLVGGSDFKIRVLNKRCSTVDNVLHFLFDVNYSEINQQEFIKMQKETTNTRM